MHQRGVDAVLVHVAEDPLGVALGSETVGLAIAGDRPPVEAGGVQRAEVARTTFDHRLDLEVLLPDGAVAEVRGHPGDEQIGRLEDVAVRGNDEVLGHRRCSLRSCTDRSNSMVPAASQARQRVR